MDSAATEPVGPLAPLLVSGTDTLPIVEGARLRRVRLGVASILSSCLFLCIYIASSLFAIAKSPASNLKSVPADGRASYVKLESLGWVRGIAFPSYRLFLGIQYGQAQRWEPPKPVRAWMPNTLSAADYGPWCPSASYDFSLENDMHMRANSVLKRDADAAFWVDEACLFLNFYTPNTKIRTHTNDAHRPELSPVLVWFHGGSFISGGGADVTSQDASALVVRGVLVVTVNSRLGALGFLMSKILHGSKAAASANLGFMDQRLALEFIKQHASAFGGDPARVTIMGWSSGAASVSAHLTSARSSGLFQGAIMQSGGFAAWLMTLESAEASFVMLAKCLRCVAHGTQDMNATCVRSSALQNIINCERTIDAHNFAPVVDGIDLLHKDPADAMDTGLVQTDIPIIIGSARYDGILDLGIDATRPGLHAIIAQKCFPGNTTAAKIAMKIYDPGQGASPKIGWSASYWAAREFTADRSMTCVARKVARRWARDGKAPAFWYQWSYPAPLGDKVLEHLAEEDYHKFGGVWNGPGKRSDSSVPPHGICWPCPGAGHGSELPFLFRDMNATKKINVLDKTLRVTGLGATMPVDALIGEDLADAMQELWVQFVKNHTALSDGFKRTAAGTPVPAWNPVSYEARVGPALVIEGAGMLSPLVNGYKAEQCDFWDSAPPVSC